MTGDKLRCTVDLALRLFQGEKIAITGITRSGKVGTMTIDSGGAFTFDGEPEDMIAASLVPGKEDTHGKR